jgi:DNA-binding NarL/FixJ family response regulator
VRHFAPKVCIQWISPLARRWSQYRARLLKNRSEEAAIYQALVLGVRDYVNKNGFPGVVLGLSGGIDSALTLRLR